MLIGYSDFADCFVVRGLETNSRYIEELVVIFERDEESPIIFILVAHFIFRGLGPPCPCITPVPPPLSLAPRISNLNKFYFGTFFVSNGPGS